MGKGLHPALNSRCSRTFCIANLQSAGGRAGVRSGREGLLGLSCINHRGSYWAYVKQPIQLPRLASWPPKTETGLVCRCIVWQMQQSMLYRALGFQLGLPRAVVSGCAAVRWSLRFICAFQKGSQLCCVCCVVCALLVGHGNCFSSQ